MVTVRNLENLFDEFKIMVSFIRGVYAQEFIINCTVINLEILLAS
jgi:hypothetical protein